MSIAYCHRHDIKWDSDADRHCPQCSPDYGVKILLDFDLVVDAVLIQRRVGGNLAEVLTNISHTIRERIRIRGEVNALTGQARLSGWVLGLLPVATGFAIYLSNPEYIEPLISTPFGYALITGAAISEVFGMLVIRKIADVKA